MGSGREDRDRWRDRRRRSDRQRGLRPRMCLRKVDVCFCTVTSLGVQQVVQLQHNCALHASSYKMTSEGTRTRGSSVNISELGSSFSRGLINLSREMARYVAVNQRELQVGVLEDMKIAVCSCPEKSGRCSTPKKSFCRTSRLCRDGGGYVLGVQLFREVCCFFASVLYVLDV